MGIFEQVRHALSSRIWLAVLAVLAADQAFAQGAVKSVHKDCRSAAIRRPAPNPSSAR